MYEVDEEADKDEVSPFCIMQMKDIYMHLSETYLDIGNFVDGTMDLAGKGWHIPALLM